MVVVLDGDGEGTIDGEKPVLWPKALKVLLVQKVLLAPKVLLVPQVLLAPKVLLALKVLLAPTVLLAPKFLLVPRAFLDILLLLPSNTPIAPSMVLPLPSSLFLAKPQCFKPMI